MKNTFCILLFNIILLASCTTMRGHKQRIKLSSNPKGANVYFKNELIGTTPGFFHIRRSFSTKLTLKKNGFEDLTYPLKTSYRWGDSFFSNLIFIYFAPVGWAVDILTGTAWNYDKISPHNYPTHTPVLEESFSKKKLPKESGRFIAIAPSQHENPFLSTEITEKLSEKLTKSYPNDTILPFQKTEKIFLLYNYTNTKTIKPEFRDDLYEKLNVTHVLNSKIIDKNRFILTKAELFDIFSEKSDTVFL